MCNISDSWKLKKQVLQIDTWLLLWKKVEVYISKTLHRFIFYLETNLFTGKRRKYVKLASEYRLQGGLWTLWEVLFRLLRNVFYGSSHSADLKCSTGLAT